MLGPQQLGGDYKLRSLGEEPGQQRGGTVESSLSSLAGRRIRLDLPDFEPITKTRTEYEKLTSEIAIAQGALEQLGAKREAARQADTAAYAKALRGGKADPGTPKTDAVDAEIVAAQRKLAALVKALDDVEGELIAAIEQHREEWLAEVDETLEQEHTARRQLISELAEARETIVTTSGLRVWLAGFPMKATSVRRGVVLPVAGVLGRNGEAIAWETIKQALEADLEPVREPMAAIEAVPA